MDDGLDYGMFDASDAAVTWWTKRVNPGARVLLVADDDTDGVTSAHVLRNAFEVQGYEVDVSIRALHTAHDVRQALDQRHDAFAIADAGSAMIPALEEVDAPVLVLDHHAVQPVPSTIVYELNPRRVGGSRTWAVSASIVSGVFATQWSPKNWAAAWPTLAGGVADRQHLGGLQGLLGYVWDEAVGRNLLSRSSGLTLVGQTVAQALSTSLDPLFPRLLGDEDAARRLCTTCGVDPEAHPTQVSGPSLGKLADALAAELASSGGPADRIYPIVGEQMGMRDATTAPTVLFLARMLEAATAERRHGDALAALAGDQKVARSLWRCAAQRQDVLVGEARRLITAVEETPTLRHAQTRDAANTGVYAHALLGFVYGDDRPLMVHAATGPIIRISVRGSPRLFLNGIDLAAAVSHAATSAGGNGGGHPGAAGAAIPAGGLDSFLEAFANFVKTQQRGSAR